MEVNVLDQPVTKDYELTPSYFTSSYTSMSRYPYFSLTCVQEMMRDARIRLGLELIIGPILAKGKFSVDTENDEVADYVQETLDMIWGGIDGRRALYSMVYGYACNEVLYEVRQGLVKFKELKPLHPMDCRYVKNERTGNQIGAAVRIRGNRRKGGDTNAHVLLLGPKCLWSTHGRDFSPYYGQSRLYNSHIPWLEKWGDGCFRDSRRLFFHKQAFSGGTMYHPPGVTNMALDASLGQAQPVANSELARRMVDQLRTGGTLFIPRQASVAGTVNPWEWIPGEVSQTPQGLLDYGTDLDNEIWQGMGILPEVISAPETGTLGNGGRSIPMDGFNAILHSVFCEIITDIVKQILHPMVILNFGRENTWFTVKPYGLLKDNDQVDDMAGAATQEQQDGIPGSPSSGKENTGTAMSLAIQQAVRANKRYRGYGVSAGGNLLHGE